MADHQAGKTIGAQDARQGEIILRHKWSRAIFAGGIAAIVAFAIAFALAAA